MLSLVFTASLHKWPVKTDKNYMYKKFILQVIFKKFKFEEVKNTAVQDRGPKKVTNLTGNQKSATLPYRHKVPRTNCTL